MRFQINQSQWDQMGVQLSQFEKEGVITKAQKETMLSAYDVKKMPSIVSIASTVGAVFVGVGILVFIAGNWGHTAPLARLFVLLMGLIGTYSFGMKWEKTHPRTAWALRILSLFIFGGGIFLTDQTFNLNRSIPALFLIFALGSLVAHSGEKNGNVFYYVFSSLLSVVFIATFLEGDFFLDSSPVIWFLGVIGLMAGRFIFQKSALTAIGKNLNALSGGMAVLSFFRGWDAPPLVMLWIGFIWGVLVIYLFNKRKANSREENTALKTSHVGFIFLGICGLILTTAGIWEVDFFQNGHNLAFGFSVVFVALLLYFFKKGHFNAIIVLVAVILRYYFDMFYDFMPKALFFIVGGLLLMGLGFYMEIRRRREKSEKAK